MISSRPGGRPPVPPDVRTVGPDRKNRDFIRPSRADESYGWHRHMGCSNGGLEDAAASV